MLWGRGAAFSTPLVTPIVFHVLLNMRYNNQIFVLFCRSVSSVVALPSNIICNKIPGLTPKQRSICRKRPDAIVTIGDGVKLGLKECHYQFKNMRWNCTNIKQQNTMFGITHSVGEFQLLARGEFRYNLKPLSHSYRVGCKCSTR